MAVGEFPGRIEGSDAADLRRRLLSSEDRFAAFVRNVPCAAFIKDAEGRYLLVNERLELIRGVSPGEWIGKSDAQIFPPEVASRLSAYDAEVLSSGRAVERIEETPHADGVHQWLLTRFPIQAADGAPMLGGIGFDVTTRLRAEEEREWFVDAERAARSEAEGVTRRLEALSKRLLDVQETERRRIARELHDEVGQLLTGLKLRIEAGDPKARDGETRAIVDDLVARVRDLSMNLMPPMLDDLGLLPALMWHVERYTAQTRVRVRFRHAGLDRRFPDEIELAAFRLAQEGLTNVARHAGVAEARLDVWASTADLGVQVEDDGPGFDAAAAVRGASIGLPGMRERVRLAGGRLSIESEPGAGTRLSAVLPIGVPANG